MELPLPSSLKEKYCKKCGNKLIIKDIVSREFDSMTGRNIFGYLLMCPQIRSWWPEYSTDHKYDKVFLNGYPSWETEFLRIHRI